MIVVVVVIVVVVTAVGIVVVVIVVVVMVCSYPYNHITTKKGDHILHIIIRSLIINVIDDVVIFADKNTHLCMSHIVSSQLLRI